MVIILMGVAGCGKSTVGSLLAERLGWEFIEGDDFHPADNRVKMAAGIPLTDEDRAAWLDRLRELIQQHLDEELNAVLACSALKQRYRDRLHVDPRRVRFVYLRGNYDLILERMQERSSHYMRPEMLASQFADLEEPADALEVDIRLPVEKKVERITDGYHL